MLGSSSVREAKRDERYDPWPRRRLVGVEDSRFAVDRELVGNERRSPAGDLEPLLLVRHELARHLDPSDGDIPPQREIWSDRNDVATRRELERRAMVETRIDLDDLRSRNVESSVEGEARAVKLALSADSQASPFYFSESARARPRAGQKRKTQRTGA
jgi:hypothetical protein